MSVKQEQQRLLSIAKGCLEVYSGGHRDEKSYRIYRHGMQTVVNALESAVNQEDTQTHALEHFGR